MEALIEAILNLDIPEEVRQSLLKELKSAKKQLDIAEFKYNRTLMDKSAITNVLNNTISELDKQKKIIEKARNEIAENMRVLDDQKKIIETKNEELNHTINILEATQTQLIQSEKMASLGELTAGIAHEIQNPLNFVNNFSDLSMELAVELKEEIQKLDLSEEKKEGLFEIINDLASNQEKINHHGKRASNIVKGMLEHSRTSNGVKSPTDINELADEYLRLAYHGLRAKDKTFNATLKTNYDKNIEKIPIVSQDIGRVLLNLFTNAFYAVSQKKKQSADAGYVPTVSITTIKKQDVVEIIVEDNGNGIPAEILNKIFQPFFTTKPTGDGTGLGLSLSYDIMKYHNGDIKVESIEGENTKFILNLPQYPA